MSRDERVVLPVASLDRSIGVTLEDPAAEGSRLVEAAGQVGLDLYLLGGVAIRVACASVAQRPKLRRNYQDIDVAIRARAATDVTRLLVGEGYEPNRRFNAINGESRLLFNDLATDRHIDVFMGTFHMCHKLALEPRLSLAEKTLSASDLLLLKLQIVQLNHKDVVDLVALLLTFEPTFGKAAGGFDVDYIATVCASDWGWYRTLTDNLAQVLERAEPLLADPTEVRVVRQRVDALLGAIEQAPKSMAWRMRNRVGRRLPWYDLPEEVITQT